MVQVDKLLIRFCIMYKPKTLLLFTNLRLENQTFL